MNNHIKTTILVSVLTCAIIVGVLIFVLIRYAKNKVDNNEDPYTTPIAYGDRGENVKKLQSFLNSRLTFYADTKGGKPLYNGAPIDELDVDGIYGKRTKCVCEWWFSTSTVTLNDIKL